MGYKDPEVQKKYAREWVKKRHQEWIKAHGPCVKCKSWEGLQVDHVDPEIKVSHRIWSWSKSKRDEELKKCQVLCRKCHEEKTARYRRDTAPHGYSLYQVGCRCDVCREGHRAYKQRWRATRRALGLSAP